MKLLQIILLTFITTLSIAKEIPSRPTPPRLVNDFAGVLSGDETYVLEQKLIKYSDSTSSQIAIVIEPTLGDAEIFDYSMQIAEKWGIGQQGKNNGILIYVAINERKIRIQVGYGLEATITDALTKRIIEEIIKPNFKTGNYFVGLNSASDAIIAAAKGEYKAEAPKSGGKGKKLLGTFVIILVILFILSKMNNNNTNYGSRGGGMDWWTAAMIGSALGGGRGRSYGDFSSGSGSFGGFGGGSFGGGGSGGDW